MTGRDDDAEVRRRALASTVPPADLEKRWEHQAVSATHGKGTSAGAGESDVEEDAISRSPLELADRHAVRKPSVVRLPRGPDTLPHALPERDPDRLLSEMKAKLAIGDYSGTMLLAQMILEEEPQHTEAQRVLQHCESALIKMISSRIGPMTQVVKVRVTAERIRWLSLDHRSGFLLSLADGRLTIEQLLDISGMKRLDALRILQELQEQAIVSFE